MKRRTLEVVCSVHRTCGPLCTPAKQASDVGRLSVSAEISGATLYRPPWGELLGIRA
jgi:hypothetical protein